MKFKILIPILILLIGIAPGVFSQDGDAILGIWQTQHGSAKIQIYKSGSHYEGKLVWVKEAIINDNSGGNEAEAKQSVKGTEVLSNFTYSGDGTWEGGTVYDPRSQKSYKCKIYMSSSSKLEVRAFLGISMIGKSQIWSRVN